MKQIRRLNILYEFCEFHFAFYQQQKNNILCIVIRVHMNFTSLREPNKYRSRPRNLQHCMNPAGSCPR